MESCRSSFNRKSEPTTDCNTIVTEFEVILRVVLMLSRLIVFGLTIGLTLISFQAYRERPSDRLEAAFIGFAFLSMGIAVTVIRTQTDALQLPLQIVETVPFIIGFGMLYMSLYK